jgi:hypothetical protein
VNPSRAVHERRGQPRSLARVERELAVIFARWGKSSGRLLLILARRLRLARVHRGSAIDLLHACKGVRCGSAGHLREISYAWALAPITLWIFVAYVRIHARTSQDGRKEILRSFYASAGPIITRELPKTISENDFESNTKEANLWANSCADWIEKNIGNAARARFLDRTGIEAASYQGAVNERHNATMSNLTRLRQDLLAMKGALVGIVSNPSEIARNGVVLGGSIIRQKLELDRAEFLKASFQLPALILVFVGAVRV